MTTVSSLLQEASRALQPTRITCAADRDLGHLEAEILLGYVLKKEKTWLLIHGEQKVTSPHAKKFRDLVARRQKHEPIAHLIHEREFYRRPFSVGKHTLIPRPETELIIEEVLELHTEGQRITIWDVGTGSGAIAVTLAKEIPSAVILATDVSSMALMAAKYNAKRHHVSERITCLKSDLLQPPAYRWLKKQGTQQLVIAANLPYLPISDKKKLAPDVVEYEPSSALFSGPDGLTLIKRFLGQLSRHIPEWGYDEVTMLFEFDPPQAKTLKDLAKKLFPKAKVAIQKDLAGRERMLKISL